MKEIYEPKETAYPAETIIIAVKTGKCDICRTRKKILLLRYGFSLCEDCLSICTSILEQLNSETTPQKNKETLLAAEQDAAQNKSYPKHEASA